MTERFEVLETVSEATSSTLLRARVRQGSAEVLLRRWKAGTAGLEAITETLRAVAGMQHPHLEKIVEAGMEDGVLQAVYHPREGETLVEILREGPLRAAEFEMLAEQLCEGLAAMHERGLVHGALRPELVQVARLGAQGWKVRIGGFGLGFEGEAEEDFLAWRCAAPEIWEGTGARRRSDVYALGCVCYEALAGRPAFAAHAERELRHKHLKHDVLPLEKLAPHVPRWMTAWVMRLMTAAAEKRFANAGIPKLLFAQREASLVATLDAPPTSTVVAQGPDYFQPPSQPPLLAPVPLPAGQPQAPTTHAVPIQTTAKTRAPSARVPRPPGMVKPAKTGPAFQMPPKLVLVGAGGVLLLVVALLWPRGSGLPYTPATPSVAVSPAAASLSLAKPPPASKQPLKTPSIPVVTATESGIEGTVKFEQVGDYRMRSTLQKPPGSAIAYPANFTPPPAAEHLVLHYRADMATYTYSGQEAETRPAQEGEIFAEWHDFGPLLQDNTLSAMPWMPGNDSIRVRTLRPEDGLRLRGPRRFLVFSSGGNPSCSAFLSARDDVRLNPFAQSESDGITQAVLFYAKEDDEEDIVSQMGLSGTNLNVRLSSKRELRVIVGNGAKDAPEAEKIQTAVLTGIDFSQPALVIVRWRDSAPSVRVAGFSGTGKTAFASIESIVWPKRTLSGFVVGGEPNYSYREIKPSHRFFDGGIAEILLYNHCLDDREYEALRSQMVGHYFP